MVFFTKVDSTNTDSLMRRIVKILRLGKSDVQTAFEVGSYGIDSNPVKDMVAIYAESSVKGEVVIVGYITKNKVAQTGELRLYSTNAQGTEQTYAYLKNDGTIELAGNADNLVRFVALNTALQAQVGLINVELGKIATAINAIVPGAYIPTPITLNITASKVNELKTT